MKLHTLISLFAVLAVVSGCETAKEAKNLSSLGVDFKFEKRHGCVTNSPSFRISGIPAGTKYLKFDMTDLDFTAFDHGGGIVSYKGTGDIPEGALKSYRGPCPPEEHRYEMVVKALNDKKDLILAKGNATRNFCCR